MEADILSWWPYGWLIQLHTRNISVLFMGIVLWHPKKEGKGWQRAESWSQEAQSTRQGIPWMRWQSISHSTGRLEIPVHLLACSWSVCGNHTQPREVIDPKSLEGYGYIETPYWPQSIYGGSNLTHGKQKYKTLKKSIESSHPVLGVASLALLGISSMFSGTLHYG